MFLSSSLLFFFPDFFVLALAFADLASELFDLSLRALALLFFPRAVDLPLSPEWSSSELFDLPLWPLPRRRFPALARSLDRPLCLEASDSSDFAALALPFFLAAALAFFGFFLPSLRLGIRGRPLCLSVSLSLSLSPQASLSHA